VTHRIALASCDRLLPEGDEGDLPLIAALQARGAQVQVHSWSDPHVDWAAFDATVIRSTWDYPSRHREFLAWLRRVPRIFNPAEVVAENIDKLYLAELTRAGLPVVPTVFIEPASTGSPTELPTVGEYVIKPSVGGGSMGVGRYDAGIPADQKRGLQHVRELGQRGITALLQPYQSAVDRDGETALIFIDGEFSHAVRKAAMLPEGASAASAASTASTALDSELYRPEKIEPITPSAIELDVARRFVDHFNHGRVEPLLYARIDLLPAAAGPLLVEAELSEPSLFLDHCPQAAGRLAASITRRLS